MGGDQGFKGSIKEVAGHLLLYFGGGLYTVRLYVVATWTGDSTKMVVKFLTAVRLNFTTCVSPLTFFAVTNYKIFGSRTSQRI